MEKRKKNNLKLVNEYFDKLREDLLKHVEDNDDVVFEIEPIKQNDVNVTQFASPVHKVLYGTKISISQGGNLKFELLDHSKEFEVI